MPARFALALAAILFSTGGAAIKAISLNAWQTAGLRSLIAASILFILLPEARRGWHWRIIPTSLAYAACLTLFVHANKMTTSANAIFLQATAPAWLLLIGPLVLKEPVRRRDLLYSVLLAAGMGLFFAGVPGGQQTASNPMLGNILALLSGLAWALTIAGIRWQARGKESSGSLATVVLGNALTAAAALPMAFPLAATLADWSIILYLGVFQVGLAYIFLTRGMKHVQAFESSAILLLEPVLNPIWTWLIHGERTGVFALVGATVIIVSTLWHARRSA
ncbi:MAG TPA: DMT family transporter [Bryobacteraceae bacterium]|nr:DMT family transporter [Bryobacteraceae bacterium]HPT27915.1 DMT family transporter [Bryobacteraceae bacterium]